eukprot:1130850-Rhodomonas_salina.1
MRDVSTGHRIGGMQGDSRKRYVSTGHRMKGEPRCFDVRDALCQQQASNKEAGRKITGCKVSTRHRIGGVRQYTLCPYRTSHR